jgi:predicted Zn-dependent protease with MMP-like domain
VATASSVHPDREHRRTLSTPATIAPAPDSRERDALMRDPGPAAPYHRPMAELQSRSARRAQRRSPRRRDRRGRGLRGLIYPPSTPAARTRAEKFDAVVLEALEPIELRWGSELAELDLAVDEVPEVDETSPDDVVWAQGVLADVGVPLARLVPAGVDPEGLPSRARIVLYRRPLEARARGGEDLADLLHEVLVEQVAEYLGIEPDAVDGGPE